jgi:hypothetical protein
VEAGARPVTLVEAAGIIEDLGYPRAQAIPV